MHALMPTLLLQLTGLDAFDGDAQTQPPDREFGKVEQRVGGGSKCGIAKWLVNEGELTSEDKNAVEFIAAICGIIHDLGNPPFGHAGKDAIAE